MITQTFDWPAFREVVTGTSGTGKTTLFEKMLRKEKARWKFIFDAKQGQFWQKYNHKPCFSFDEIEVAMGKGAWVVYDPVKEFPGNTPAAFVHFCKFLKLIMGEFPGRKILGVEELQKCIPGLRDPQEFLELLDTGRTFKLDVIANGQGLNRINCNVRNQITKIYTFRQSDKNAISHLSENGFDEEKIRTLQNGKFLWRNMDTGAAGEGGEAF